MKWLFCLIFGHNKTLESSIENILLKYYTVCSQCHRRWLDKELSRIAYVESIKKPIQQESKNLESKIVIKRKQMANIYVL